MYDLASMARRDFVKLACLGAGALMLPGLPASAWAKEGDDPHFFIQILFPNGWDPSYLMDARPLEMTAQSLIQNYLGEEPSAVTGKNGASCRMSSLFKPLFESYRERVSVLNGVIMATTFDGHDQNTNFLFTGNPFGGESFVPHLNRAREGQAMPTPLDALKTGSYFASLTNSEATIPLTIGSAKTLVENLQGLPPLSMADPVTAWIQSRFQKAASGAGVFSRGAQKIVAGYEQAPALAKLIRSLQVPAAPPPQGGVGASTLPQLQAFLKLTQECFKKGVSRSAIFSLTANGYSIDTHAPEQAKDQRKYYAAITDSMRAIFGALDEPYDQTRSFWDVTTVLVGSEFGRTMRQAGIPIDKTGTDHNPLSNSFLLGGKGVLGGQIVGASDRESVALAGGVSQAHQQLDPTSVKLMGKPFDFSAGLARADLPEVFSAADYLNVASVTNTLYSLFGVKKDHYRTLERNGPIAPVLATLLGP